MLLITLPSWVSIAGTLESLLGNPVIAVVHTFDLRER
jgi:hypothetical protein